MKILSVVGWLCILFAAADFILGNFFHTDITGSRYSPVIAAGVGLILIKLHDRLSSDKEEDKESDIEETNAN